LERACVGIPRHCAEQKNSHADGYELDDAIERVDVGLGESHAIQFGGICGWLKDSASTVRPWPIGQQAKTELILRKSEILAHESGPS